MSEIPADWSSEAFRTALVTLVRRRIPERDVEDVVQIVLSEAISSPHRPAEPQAARRWIYGIVRNKIVDYHRGNHREVLEDTLESTAQTHAHSDEEVQSLLRWTLRELPAGMDAERTLAWLLRESEGESLEDIAAAEQIPAPALRQRVSRLRKHFRERWTLHLAALAAVGALAGLVWIVLRRPKPTTSVLEEPVRTAMERGRQQRIDAMRACEEQKWAACLRGLDEARSLDPEGDRTEAVQAARARATRALQEPVDAGEVPRLPAPNVMQGPDASVDVEVAAPVESVQDAGVERMWIISSDASTLPHFNLRSSDFGSSSSSEMSLGSSGRSHRRSRRVGSSLSAPRP